MLPSHPVGMFCHCLVIHYTHTTKINITLLIREFRSNIILQRFEDNLKNMKQVISVNIFCMALSPTPVS